MIRKKSRREESLDHAELARLLRRRETRTCRSTVTCFSRST